MKLTDIMFNMEYVAAEVGSGIVQGGDVFKSETLTAVADGDKFKLTLSKTAVPIVSGGSNYAWVKSATTNNAVQTRKLVDSNNKVEVDAAGDYCVMYKYTNSEADVIKVDAQFIPSVLHAVLTVALYFGDSCNIESSIKAGEVTIDIPRLQLSGAMDLTMSATGASQTALGATCSL